MAAPGTIGRAATVKDAARHEREKEIFLKVKTLPESRWDAALISECGSDQDLLAAVRALLLHARADQTLDPQNTAERLAEFREELSGRYRIHGEVGRGAMGTVYAAEDLKHERRVAIKVLPEYVAAALGTERFAQEVKVTASFNHPHILPLLDSGQAAGTLFYVMPFVEGETVRDRLRREGTVPPPEAFRLAAEVADALAYSHRRDVVHRDIKPENIMLAEGHAVVSDFGIARVRSPDASDRLTRGWSPMGTPGYMSPEQFWPEREVDGKTDVYSLSHVLHEMLTGGLPGLDPTEPGTPDRASQQTAAFADVLGMLPTETVRVLSRAQRTDPGERPTAEQFADALRAAANHLGSGALNPAPRRRLWAAGLAGIAAASLLAAGLILSRNTTQADATPADAPSIAVLPFESLGGGAEQYLGDGFSDAIAARLAKMRGLNVVSRHSAEQYRSSALGAGAIGGALGVAYLLEGTVQRERPGDPNSSVRVIPKLIRTADDVNVWAETYDEDMTELFRVQSEIAEEVARQMAVTLAGSADAMAPAPPTESLEAYDLYLRADPGAAPSFEFDVGGLRSSEDLLERAIALDPEFALAHAELSRVHLSLFRAADRRPERLAAAERSFNRALELAPQLPEAHFAAAYYHYFGRLDVDQARAELERVLEIQPSNAAALRLMAPLLAARGEWDRAAETAALASDLDPLSASYANTAAVMNFRAGRREISRTYVDRAVALDPNDADHHSLKAMIVYAGTGDVEESKRLIARAVPLVPPLELASAIHTHDLWGVVRDGEYDWLFEQLSLESVEESNPLPHYLTQAKFYYARKNVALARAYFDSVLVHAELLYQQLPDNHLSNLMLAVAQAGVGRAQDALASAERYMEIKPFESDHFEASAAAWHIAFVHMLAGNPVGAIEILRWALDEPTWITVHTLRDNPIWDALRGEPAFQELIQD